MNTTELLNTNVTKLYEEIDDYIALAVEGVIIPLIAFFGLIGNILSIIVLQSKGINMKVRNVLDGFSLNQYKWIDKAKATGRRDLME